jgi:hypothetical protein
VRHIPRGEAIAVRSLPTGLARMANSHCTKGIQTLAAEGEENSLNAVGVVTDGVSLPSDRPQAVWGEFPYAHARKD